MLNHELFLNTSQNNLPLLLFEDDHLLVINKPSGLNTHAPSPFAGEGIYDWLRHREPRWASLAIVHRLDKETSGLLVFGKSPKANRSLTEQFTRRQIRKKYLLLTDRQIKQREFNAVSCLVRSGEKYLSRPLHPGGARAETRFHLLGSEAGLAKLSAEPVTGRTHQIRVHAAEHGFPILGDKLYGGTPAPRLCLHAEELTLKHPATAAEMTFHAPAEIEFWTSQFGLLKRREALLDPRVTNAFRIIHGASDGWPGWYVDRVGDFLLSQSEHSLTREQGRFLEQLINPGARIPFSGPDEKPASLRGVYHKVLRRTTAAVVPRNASPQHLLGETAPDRFVVHENGLKFELSFNEGYSVGLFLDQRENRRRLLVNHVAANFPLLAASPGPTEVLNVFAYTCGFSVAAAKAGANTTSLDLSRKYLEWGQRNFLANQIDPARHEFIFGDAFDWLRRMAKKRREFDLLLLDPPTFSRSKHGVFQAEKDYDKLVLASLPLLKPEGVLFASTNAATWAPEAFLAKISAAVDSAKRKILHQHYAPQPPDFPVSRAEPAYLKTVWMRIG